MIGNPTVTQDPNCSHLALTQGNGCKTTTATFATIKAGTATITAVTTFCGEARLCRPSDLNYQLTIVIQ